MIRRAFEPGLVHPAFRGVKLTQDSVQDGLRLSEAASWNQTERDWLYLLQTGLAYGFEDAGGDLVASMVLTPYAADLLWVSMVLVSAKARQQGLASALLRHESTVAQRANRISMLDATPAGREVYLKLGYHDLFGITRWRRPAGSPSSPASRGSRPLRIVEPWLGWDEARFGPNRAVLLTMLASDRPDLAWQWGHSRNETAGFGLGRSGREATQIGPIMADSEAIAVDLLGHTLEGRTDALLCDVVDGHPQIETTLAAQGFAPQRTFVRMARGEPKRMGIVTGAKIFLTAGPELG